MVSIPRSGLVAGLDESGRGSLAGPVVAAATVIVSACYQTRLLKQFPILRQPRDSKKIPAKQRQQIFNELRQCPGIFFATAKVSNKVIDKINISQATKLAMQRAVKALELKAGQEIGLLLIDGNFYLNINKPQQPIIKGDENNSLIKLASIVAKVTRDKTMATCYHQKFPSYEFCQHKGYGTKQHLQRIKEFGPCPIHRKTFKPIANLPSTTQHYFS